MDYYGLQLQYIAPLVNTLSPPFSSYPQSTLIAPEQVDLFVIYDLVSDPYHSALTRLPDLRVPPHRIVASSRPIRKINSH